MGRRPALYSEGFTRLSTQAGGHARSLSPILPPGCAWAQTSYGQFSVADPKVLGAAEGSPLPRGPWLCLMGGLSVGAVGLTLDAQCSSYSSAMQSRGEANPTSVQFLWGPRPTTQQYVFLTSHVLENTK